MNALESVLRAFYTMLLTIALPFLLGRRLFKDRRNAQERKRWLERFGVYSQAFSQSGSIWIHAVSVGEFLAVLSLVRACKAHFPDRPIIITTTTPTAAAQVQRVLGDQVVHAYFPYDLIFVMCRFLNHFKPAIALIVETELWPNLLWVCEKNHLPVLVINACLSQRSLRGYQRFKILSTAMMNRINKVCAQTEEEGSRFLSLGLKPDRLCITGNLKFDQLLPVGIGEQSQVLREQWGRYRPVWIAASTHRGEEAIILQVFKTLGKTFPDLLLVLAPRHPERCSEVKKMIHEAGYEPLIRSTATLPHLDTAVYLVDTLGELNLFYSASDVAFVGGSLVPVGGHNVLEPALFAVPILVGPYMFNCLEVVSPLKNVGALVQIPDQAGLMSALATWLSDPVGRKQAGLEAQRIVEENRGAVLKTLDCIQNLLQ